MPEKELIYAELAWPEKPVPARRPVARGRSESESSTVYAEIDFNVQKPSSPRRSRHYSTEDLPPPLPDIYAEHIRRIKPHPAPYYEETDPPDYEAPPLPPRIRYQSTEDFPPLSPEDIDEPIHQTLDEARRYLGPRLPSNVAPRVPAVPPRDYTYVFYPATPAQRPPRTGPRDPVCNFVGLSDKRDLKPRDPVLLQQYALNNPVLPDPVFECDMIYRLKKENINLFLKCRDLAMILFYNPEDLGKRTGLKKRFVNAASITSRYNHAYATVNCQQERELCNSYKITKTPVFHVFTLNNLVGSFRDSATDPVTLKRYVENVPLIKRHK